MIFLNYLGLIFVLCLSSVGFVYFMASGQENNNTFAYDDLNSFPDYNSNFPSSNDQENRYFENYPGGGNNIIEQIFSKSSLLDNQFVNRSSIMGFLGYSVVENVKPTGARILNNTSISIQISFFPKNDSKTVSPPITAEVYKIGLNVKNLLSSTLASSYSSPKTDHCLNTFSDDCFDSQSSQSSFDYSYNTGGLTGLEDFQSMTQGLEIIGQLLDNIKISSAISKSGWDSPHELTVTFPDIDIDQKNNNNTIDLVFVNIIPLSVQ